MKLWRLLNLKVWLPVFLFACLLSQVYWNGNFPYTHDGANHLARFMNFAAALREGQFPPRFAPYAFSGFGVPVFLYNYPLPNILALPLLVAGLHPERVFAVIVTTFLTLGIGATYLSLRRFFSRSASAFGTALYSTSWYLVTTLMYRGGIGELLAYSLVPAVFLCLNFWQETHEKKYWWFSVGLVTALLLAHNVLALMGCGLLGLWSLGWLMHHRERAREWLALWLTPVALSLWFWLPALAEMNLVALAGDNLRTETASHALGWQELLFSPWRFGFSRPGLLDSLGFGQGPAFLATGVMAVVMVVRKILVQKKREHSTSAAVLVGGGIILSLYLATTWSRPVWESVSVLSVLQFPWRWLFVGTLLFVPTAAWTFDQLSVWKIRLLLLLTIVWQTAVVFSLRPVDRFHADPLTYLHFAETTTTRNENRPLTFQLDTLPSWQPEPIIATGSAEARVESWLGSRRQYQLHVFEDAVVMEPTVYFPGWEVFADREKLIPIFTDDTKGLVAYELPARSEPYLIRSGFTGRTLPRVVSEVISLATLLGLIGYGARSLWQRRK